MDKEFKSSNYAPLSEPLNLYLLFLLLSKAIKLAFSPERKNIYIMYLWQRGPLSLVTTTEELLDRKVAASF
jgi:hypothetical protein